MGLVDGRAFDFLNVSSEIIMALRDTLTGWIDGPPSMRDDGGLAIVALAPGVRVDGQDHFDLPIVVTRWSAKLKTTGGGHRLDYDDVLRHIDIAA